MGNLLDQNSGKADSRPKSEINKLTQKKPPLKNFQPKIPNYTKKEHLLGEKLLHNCLFGHLSKIKECISGGAPVDYLDPSTSKNALYNSVCNQQIEVIKLLIQSKADINYQFSEKETALLAASRQGNDEIISIFTKHPELDVQKHTNIYFVNPIHSIVFQPGREYSLELLLRAGFDPNLLTNLDLSPLHYCVHSGDSSQLNTLLDFGANIDVNKTNSEGETPLLMLLKQDKIYMDCLSALLSHLSNPSICDVNGINCFEFIQKNIYKSSQVFDILQKHYLKFDKLKMFCLCVKRWEKIRGGYFKLGKYLKIQIMRFILMDD